MGARDTASQRVYMEQPGGEVLPMSPGRSQLVVGAESCADRRSLGSLSLPQSPIRTRRAASRMLGTPE